MSLSKESISKYAFWGIIGINLLYLNGLFTNFFKITAIFSPIILVCCIIVIFTTPWPKINSYLFVSIILFFVCYLYIGTISLILFPENTHVKTQLAIHYRAYLSSMLIYFAVFQYIQNVYYRHGAKKLIDIVNISFLLLLLPLFFTIFGKELGLTEAMTYAKDFGDRQIGIFSNPNNTGLHANFLLCFSLYSLLSNKKGKLFWLLLVPVCCYAAFLSLSKAAMIMVVINLVFYLVFSVFNITKLKPSIRFATFISIFIFIASSFYLYNNFYQLLGKMTYAQGSRLVDAIELSRGKVNRATTSDRVGFAEMAFPKIMNHIVIGNGFGSFHRLKETGLGIHNTALLVIGESGIIALVVYVIFVLLYLINAIKIKVPAIKYLMISVFFTFLFISFLTSHNGLEERMSNIILAIFISVSPFLGSSMFQTKLQPVTQ